MDQSEKNSVNEHQNLIKCYVSVCNQALLENAERFPFKQIMDAARNSEHDQPIEVVISNTHPPERYIFRLNKQGIACEAHKDCEDCECVRSWVTSKSYLKDVTEMPAAYIENPALLDWDWMYDSQ